MKNCWRRYSKGTPYDVRWGRVRRSIRPRVRYLQKFYHTWYAPNNAIFVIAGDVQPETTLAVRRLFESIPPKKLPRRPTFEFESVKPAKMQMTSDLSYGMAVITFRMLKFGQCGRRGDAGVGGCVVDASR